MNDLGGHAAGDALLREIAGAIQSAVRANDVVARLGGDEFGVILRSCPPSYARLVAQNIVDTIAAIDFHWDGVTHRVGASIGLATVNTKSDLIDAIMERADRACYAARQPAAAVCGKPNSTRPGSLICPEISAFYRVMTIG